MSSIGRLGEIVLMMIAVTSAAFSHCQARESKIQQLSTRTGTIGGKVTIDGKAAEGVRVILVPAEKTISSNWTDFNMQTLVGEDGSFKLSGVPQGTFVLTAVGRGYVLADRGISGLPGKTIILHEGEGLEDVDLVLSRGGVITGRVADAEFRPLIGERVSLHLVDIDGRSRPIGLMNQNAETDDRGVYRLYGLSPGRYVVGIGMDIRPGTRVSDGDSSRRYYPVTYYPGVLDESQAKVVEIEGSSEVTNIDIVRSRRVKTHTVAGRIVDDESGRPLQEVEFGYSDATKHYLSRAGSGYRTNLNGEFRIENVKPGRYVGFASLESNGDSYSEFVPFEVANDDVQELQIKVRRGYSITGVAVIEGIDDPEVLSQLINVTVRAVPLDSNTPDGPKTTIAQNGTFHLRGVRQGKVGLVISAPPSKNFSLVRAEQNGIEQKYAILQVTTEDTTGIKLVMAYGKGNIRGQIKVEGGKLPDGTHIEISVVKATAGRSFGVVQADPNGRFVITNIPSGNYQLSVSTMPATRAILTQGVTVTNGKDSEAVIVLDLSK
jgi:hypothetical protein